MRKPLDPDAPISPKKYLELFESDFVAWRNLVLGGIKAPIENVKPGTPIVFVMSNEPKIRRAEEEILKGYPHIEQVDDRPNFKGGR